MRTTVSIPGIHCASCAALIKDVSGDFPAVTHIDVDIDAKTVTLDHDDRFDQRDWIREIEALDPKYAVHPLP
jgi:copper chaperone CopZ